MMTAGRNSTRAGLVATNSIQRRRKPNDVLKPIVEHGCIFAMHGATRVGRSKALQFRVSLVNFAFAISNGSQSRA